MSRSVTDDISSNLLFRYRLPCEKSKTSKNEPIELKPAAALPDVGGEIGAAFPAQLRAAWSEIGLYFTLKVTGKKQSLWCKKTQLLDSDGLQIWLDTRDTHNVHRATRYCHWFLCLPQGDGTDQKKPLATMLKINRAKEHSPLINQYPVLVDSKISKSGYLMNVFIPGSTINGWDPSEHRMLGFNFQITDRELGSHCLSAGLEYPIAEDPSLWHTLALLG